MHKTGTQNTVLLSTPKPLVWCISAGLPSWHHISRLKMLTCYSSMPLPLAIEFHTTFVSEYCVCKGPSLDIWPYMSLSWYSLLTFWCSSISPSLSRLSPCAYHTERMVNDPQQTAQIEAIATHRDIAQTQPKPIAQNCQGLGATGKTKTPKEQ